MAPKVFIFLPVHNRKEITRTFITSLLQQTFTNYHLVLIDDGSTDGTADMVTSLLPAATVITGTGDWWWGGSLQQGYNWICGQTLQEGDLVLIANDDVEFAPDYLQQGVDYMHTAPDTLLLSQAYSKQTGQLTDIGVVLDWRKLTFTPATNIADINCLSTRGLFLTAKALLATGGFRPALLPHYFSDYEFTLRAQRKGFKLTSDPRVRLLMNEETTGIHQLKGVSVWKYLKKIFSKRAVGNPVYYFVFIWLSCPAKYIPLNLCRVCVGFVKTFLQNSLA
ncbi:glycosyltransferase family 2 protein [Chitinophaga nivalis]|uniref:Glycosyltransferase n=1 Tax=Chitinophaga nivalis TaxID=2991709 RepID=A0ABT3IP77_9BACT|nr:glycosyltransferase [Chitinophaga nivalis]MCW3464719.1 glycosyltransferase [Chitinophaga nivalis]MCW3485590.1 glycosyltransferase [Chitinophaga nivalis]